MTRDEAKQLLPIIQAYSEGKDIQIDTTKGWVDLDDPSFNWKPSSDYRIKPEPIECWAVVNPEGLPVYFGTTYAAASCITPGVAGGRVIRMREVL